MPDLVEPVIAPGSMSSIEQPRLPVDDELELRPFELADAPTVLRAFADPNIQKWHGFRVDSIAEAEVWIAKTHELWNDEKSAVWAAVDGDDRVLGRCAMHIDTRAGTAEIAYWVLPESRGRAVASRAARSATSWTHETLGVQRILLQHSTQNPASCAVAARAGFIAEGISRQQGLHVDGWHDMHQHSHVITDPV